jgi:hypothetical protein
MAGEFSFLPFRPLIPFALMDFASGSLAWVLSQIYIKCSEQELYFRGALKYLFHELANPY